MRTYIHLMDTIVNAEMDYDELIKISSVAPEKRSTAECKRAAELLNQLNEFFLLCKEDPEVRIEAGRFLDRVNQECRSSVSHRRIPFGLNASALKARILLKTVRFLTWILCVVSARLTDNDQPLKTSWEHIALLQASFHEHLEVLDMNLSSHTKKLKARG